jgi:TPR repeat protein
MSAPAADIPENRSPAVFNPPAKPRAAQPAGSLPGVGAGAYEMSRAAHANDGDARAAWLWKAIAKGNSQASVELARMYVQGIGVPRNCDQAQILLRGAAEKGNEQARLSLQRILRQGGCTPR